MRCNENLGGSTMVQCFSPPSSFDVRVRDSDWIISVTTINQQLGSSTSTRSDSQEVHSIISSILWCCDFFFFLLQDDLFVLRTSNKCFSPKEGANWQKFLNLGGTINHVFMHLSPIQKNKQNLILHEKSITCWPSSGLISCSAVLMRLFMCLMTIVLYLPRTPLHVTATYRETAPPSHCSHT